MFIASHLRSATQPYVKFTRNVLVSLSTTPFVFSHCLCRNAYQAVSLWLQVAETRNCIHSLPLDECYPMICKVHPYMPLVFFGKKKEHSGKKDA